MHRFVRVFALSLSLVLLGACATQKMRSKQTVLDETLRSYAATIRWGELEQAQAFVDPEVLRTHPPTALELARYRQVKVTSYDEQPVMPVGEDEVRQAVEIGLVNVNTQSARSVIDRQTWRYDAKLKRWWLTSGLPDISRAE